MTKDEWVNLGPEGQQEHFKSFYNYKPASTSSTITDREQLIELSNAINSTKGKPNQRKRARNVRTNAKHPGTPLSKRSKAEFISGVDAMFMKDITAKMANNDANNDDENTTTNNDDENNTIVLDDPTSTETSVHSNNKVDSKKGSKSRKKYNKNILCIK